MTGDTRYKFIAFIAGLVILHFVLRIGLGLGPLAPDLLVVAFLLAARRIRPGTASGLGLVLGLLEGAVSFTVGASSLVLAVMGYFASRSRDMMAGDSPVLLALYLFAGKWIYDVLLYLVLWATASAGPASSLLLISPLEGLYAAAAGLAASAIYRAVV
ncbi:MAG TPA: hypothetical protein VFE05_03560 [Longimicrobiaceae bacterium]|jgi:rod shape-determining protein MreD|nr:hypothetical protein [Longimicrobiaceae bacterium]